jgi:uncharacterized protein (TIGR02270 family)
VESIRRIVEIHAEEASFLWLLRSRAVAAPHYRLVQLARLDMRLEAHVDGLRVAGDLGWEVARAQCGWKEPGEIFAAAILAFESRLEPRAAEIIGAAIATPELARGVISALGWMSFDRARSWIERLALEANPVCSRIGVRAAALHRWNAPSILARARSSPDAGVSAAAARAVGEVGDDVDGLTFCRQQLHADAEEARLWAAWSLVLCGDSSGLEVLRIAAESDSPHAERALDLAARASDSPEVHSWHRRLLESGRLRTAIELAGRCGDAVWMPWLLEQVRIPELARVAGESISFITGVDLAFQDLVGRPPESFNGGPTEDAADDYVAMDPDDDLPWPEPALVEEWWAIQRQRFSVGVPQLLGRPLTRDSLRGALRENTQRQRASAALELRRLEGRDSLFEVRAPGFAQQRALERN